MTGMITWQAILNWAMATHQCFQRFDMMNELSAVVVIVLRIWTTAALHLGVPTPPARVEPYTLTMYEVYEKIEETQDEFSEIAPFCLIPFKREQK